MAQVDLTKCDEVAKAELAYLHDIQLLLQHQLKQFIGIQKFTTDIKPKLSKEVFSSSDYLDLPL